MIRAALVLVLAAGAVGAAAPVHADPATDPGEAKAKKLYREGEKLFALGKFAAALPKYEAAFEAKQLPGFLFNIGQCHRNMGSYDQAIFSFRKYLKLKPDAANREAVLEYIDELEREKQRTSSEDLDLIAPDDGPTGPTGPVDQPGGGKPFYKKWWFWGGVAVLGAGAVGTAVILGGSSGPPDTDLGNIDFGK